MVSCSYMVPPSIDFGVQGSQLKRNIVVVTVLGIHEKNNFMTKIKWKPYSW